MRWRTKHRRRPEFRFAPNKKQAIKLIKNACRRVAERTLEKGIVVSKEEFVELCRVEVSKERGWPFRPGWPKLNK